MFKFLLVFLSLLLIANGVYATPQLKIRDTDLDCRSSFYDGGYSGCTLDVYLRIEDYDYSSQYDNYTYKVECNATFTYYTRGSYLSSHTYESNYIKIYGTNITKTLLLDTSFFAIDPVYKVEVTELSCKVKDIY